MKKGDHSPIFLSRVQSSSLKAIPLFLNVHWATSRNEMSTQECIKAPSTRTWVDLRLGRDGTSMFPCSVSFRRRYAAVSKRISTADDRASSEFWRSSRNTDVKSMRLRKDPHGTIPGSLTGELPGVARKHLVDQCTLVDFYRLILSCLPLMASKSR